MSALMFRFLLEAPTLSLCSLILELKLVWVERIRGFCLSRPRLSTLSKFMSSKARWKRFGFFIMFFAYTSSFLSTSM